MRAAAFVTALMGVGVGFLPACQAGSKTAPAPPPTWNQHFQAGQAAQAKGRYGLADAEAPYRRALEIQERTAGDHPDLAQTLDNLARVLQKGNRDQEAAPLAERARRIRQVAGSR